MDKMEIFQGIIEENIEWFWHNDPMVDYETDTEKLWNGFKTWCVQNCLEVFDDIEESVVAKMVEANYSNWLEAKWF